MITRKALYPSTCKACGRPIGRGETVALAAAPGKHKWVHVYCAGDGAEPDETEASLEARDPPTPEPAPSEYSDAVLLPTPDQSAASLTVKYRPRRLAHLVGQPEVVQQLRDWIDAPYSTAMLFHGETGTGKTSAAYALAYELGLSMDHTELGGFHEIPSGEMGADEVRDMLRRLRLTPLFGSGWKVLVCNEADRMSTSAETIWLDGLEHLPPRSLIVFTTNELEKLTRRLRDRCEKYPFEGRTQKLAPALRAFAQAVWQAEGGAGPMPLSDRLGLPTLSGPDSLNASFRLVLQQLQPHVRRLRVAGAIA